MIAMHNTTDTPKPKRGSAANDPPVVREHSVRCTADEVQAILEGTKTQLRFPLTPQPTSVQTGSTVPYNGSTSFLRESLRCPYGEVGEYLWIREAFVTGHETDGNGDLVMFDAEGSELPQKVWYRASSPDLTWIDDDGGHVESVPWKSSVHMPRWASRIVLELTEVRVQRLHEIGDDDAIADGFVHGAAGNPGNGGPFDAFRVRWNARHAKRGYGWLDEPWVWALTFNRCA